MEFKRELSRYQSLRSFYNTKVKTLNESIIQDKSKLEIYEENLDKMSRIDKELGDSNLVIKAIEDQQSLFYNFIKLCVKKRAEFKDTRTNMIEEKIEGNLRYLYPEKDYDVKILFDEFRGEDVAELLLGQEGDFAPLTGQNGMFVRQITSLTGMKSINKMHGGCVLFFDEALASSDKQNLLKLKPMFEDILEDGFQVIMIEHKPEIYENLNYKKIHLVRNEKTGVFVESISYSEGD